MQNDGKPSAAPLIEWHEVRRRLRLKAHEAERLLAIGMIAPVCKGAQHQALFEANAIDALRETSMARERLRDAVCGYLNTARPAPAEMPFYPFDSDEQRERALQLQQQGSEANSSKPPLGAIEIRRRYSTSIHITRAQLRDLVWSKTMIRAAADLGISEFTLRNMCKSHQIPTPSRGHFNHKDPKDRPPRPSLSGLAKQT